MAYTVIYIAAGIDHKFEIFLLRKKSKMKKILQNFIYLSSFERLYEIKNLHIRGATFNLMRIYIFPLNLTVPNCRTTVFSFRSQL